MASGGSSDLARYRAKRDPATTPEPMGGTLVRGSRFVVQHHLARREHYDLRLEHNGVLLCWAVPKGPSADPADKRLAVQTEPHPMRYTEFEGVIPEGNYGAGVMIVWDQGSYVPVTSFDEGLEAGKLLFTLHGYKLNGTWTLVRTKQDWLLIKERDGDVKTGDANSFPADSVFSGLTAEERRTPEKAVKAMSQALKKAGAKPLGKPLRAPKHMLAVTHAPFTHKDWVFELKHDGYRTFAVRGKAGVQLLSRNAKDLSTAFPDLVHALLQLPYESFVLDGEIVCLDGNGRASFSRLQGRARLSTVPDVQKATLQTPATMFAFDALQILDQDCRHLPLLKRKALLKSLLPTIGPIRYSDHLERQGEVLFDYARDLGLEGTIAKRADSPYLHTRSDLWRKSVLTATDDFVVAGWAPSTAGGRKIAAVLLATYVQGRLVYAGRAGTGISAAVERELLAEFKRLPAAEPPLEAPDEKDSHWVAPRLVAEVRYKQRSAHGLLRMPVFVRLRADKSPEECGDSATLAAPAPGPVAISNPDKLLWPKEKISKADLVDYYRRIAPFMLPYLADRAVTLVRYPDGIDEEAFFQKNAPPNTPDWLRVEPIASDDKVTDYLVLESEEALAYVANLAAVELHVRNATISSPDRPTWFNIDLDPKTAPFAWVVAAARAVLGVCDAAGLPAFLKTTGSTGLHVLLPGGGLNHTQGEMLCQLIAQLVHQELPEKTTMERVIERRGGRVYLDCGQNRAGTTIAAPYSVRARPGAPVSMPITRRELGKPNLNRQYHTRNAPKRVRTRREDPLLPLLSCNVDMVKAIAAIDSLCQ